MVLNCLHNQAPQYLMIIDLCQLDIFTLPAKVVSSCLAIVSVVMAGGLFLWLALRYGTGYQTV